MVTRPVVLAVLCIGFFLILQALVPKALAFGTNVDRFMMEDQRTQRRKNYMVQKAKNKDMAALEGFTYDIEPYDPDRNPEELSAFIVDYANMIRNDVILLDKSVETRTRKRGNIKVKKYNNNQAISDPPCTCQYDEDTRQLGENFFPKRVHFRNCSRIQQHGCPAPYKCQESIYNLPILKRKPIPTILDETVPGELQHRWYAEEMPISVGCVCSRDYVARNDDVL